MTRVEGGGALGLSHIVDELPQGVAVYRYRPEDESFELLYANAASEQILRIPLRDQLGQTLEQIAPGIRSAPLYHMYVEVMRTGATARARQQPYDDEVFAGAFDVTAIRIVPDRLAHVFDRVAPADEKERALRAELERTVAELRDRNAQLDRFAYVIAHDLKAPLRGIQLASGWLEESLGGNLDPEVKENLGFLTSRATRLSDLVSGVLRYSRARRAELEVAPLGLEAMVREALAAWTEPAVEVSSPEGWPPVLGDPTMVTQVLQNLIDNALRHGGGSAVIAVKEAGEQVEVSVSDRGPGIRPELRSQAFELFKTLKPAEASDSVGAGLTICQALVERMGGRIGVDGAEPGGARVWFTLPRAPV